MRWKSDWQNWKKRGTDRVMKHVMHGGYVKVKSERRKYQELLIHVSSQLLPIEHTAHRPHDTRIQPKPSQQKKKNHFVLY